MVTPSAVASLFEKPHRRFNALTGDWVLVSPHRAKRPWQGQQEAIVEEVLPPHDPNCYLCPGNTRTSGATNPDYAETFVFDNDFQALLADTPEFALAENPLQIANSVKGTCRVICFSPRHDLTLARMSRPELRTVIELWVTQLQELSAEYTWVQIFENRGESMGCSSPHPHGQIWALDTLPLEPSKKDRQQKAYLAEHKNVLLVDYAKLESEQGDRTVVENDDWIAVVPYWAVWPFETLLLPKKHRPRLTDLTESERVNLADALKKLLARYDNLFGVSFPYSMGWHNCPNSVGQQELEGAEAHWQCHAQFFPPLLRSATVRKFMVGFEMLGEPQRDLTPEQAAARLRECSDIHYAEK